MGSGDSGTKTDFSSFIVPWLLFTIFPLCPPVRCCGENVGLNRHLFYLFFFLSWALWLKKKKKKGGANVPMNPTNVSCCVTVMYEQAAVTLISNPHPPPKKKKLDGMPQWNMSYSGELQDWQSRDNYELVVFYLINISVSMSISADELFTVSVSLCPERPPFF